MFKVKIKVEVTIEEFVKDPLKYVTQHSSDVETYFVQQNVIKLEHNKTNKLTQLQRYFPNCYQAGLSIAIPKQDVDNLIQNNK